MEWANWRECHSEWGNWSGGYIGTRYGCSPVNALQNVDGEHPIEANAELDWACKVNRTHEPIGACCAKEFKIKLLKQKIPTNCKVFNFLIFKSV